MKKTKKSKELIKKIIAFILFAAAVSLVVIATYKISDERIDDCLSKNGQAVTDFYGLYERCIIEVRIQ